MPQFVIISQRYVIVKAAIRLSFFFNEMTPYLGMLLLLVVGIAVIIRQETDNKLYMYLFSKNPKVLAGS